ncbi:MAG: acyltransferase [Pseudomonadales bacterium]|nr:acyltransferase [Pseudomonadales bacterium]
MIHDHRPYFVKRLYLVWERWYTRHFVEPQFAALGAGAHIMKPWYVRLHGDGIRAGANLHMVTARDRQVSLSTWQFDTHQGHIEIGNNCLVCPGVRLDSASRISIADDCMLAAGVYITDADWHDIYDRTRSIGTTRPVVLEENVWVGDGAIVCKGVRIGRNSVIGAGAVVVTDIPENSIAAGNPARVVKPLDPARELVTRARLFEDPKRLAEEIDRIDRWVLGKNSIWRWITSLLRPARGD